MAVSAFDGSGIAALELDRRAAGGAVKSLGHKEALSPQLSAFSFFSFAGSGSLFPCLLVDLFTVFLYITGKISVAQAG